MSLIRLRFLNGAEQAKLAAQNNDTVIVVDVLRASSSIISLIDKGVMEVKPIHSIMEWDGFIIGEKDGKKIPGCSLNNSPSEIAKTKFLPDQVIAIKTSNGTNCILNSKSMNNTVLIGSALNAQACCNKAYQICVSTNSSLSIVMAGCHDEFAEEDFYVASIMYDKLFTRTFFSGDKKPCKVTDLHQMMLQTSAARRLADLGYHEDIAFCSRLDCSQAVPVYKKDTIVLME